LKLKPAIEVMFY